MKLLQPLVAFVFVATHVVDVSAKKPQAFDRSQHGSPDFGPPRFRAPFNPLEHSGPASPYFDAPPGAGISSDVPEGCIVDQASYTIRHGARYPEPGSFKGWNTLFDKINNATFRAKGPLNWLPTWVPRVEDVNHQSLYLTSKGSEEAFRLGAELRRRYHNMAPGGSNMTVWAAGQQRVVDTASNIVRGYLSQGSYTTSPSQNRGKMIILPDVGKWTFANSLTFLDSCSKWADWKNGSAQSNVFRATYQSKIAARLNKFLDGLTLNATDIGPMQDLCGFQNVIDGSTDFCNIFTEEEWLQYEYAGDLNYYYGSGPGNPFSATTAYPYLKTITELFMAGPGKTLPGGNFTPPPLLIGVTHDNNIPPIAAALGIWNTSTHKGVYPLPVDHMPPVDHSFRSSWLVSFRGYIALERLSCDAPLSSTVKHTAGQTVPTPGTSAHAKKYVRVLVSDSVVPIPGCTSGPGSSCPLADFDKYVSEERGAVAGDYVTVCNITGFTNATSQVDFFTNVPSESAQSSIMEMDVFGGGESSTVTPT